MAAVTKQNMAPKNQGFGVNFLFFLANILSKFILLRLNAEHIFKLLIDKHITLNWCFHSLVNANVSDN